MHNVRMNLRSSVRLRVVKTDMLPRYIVVADALTADIAKGRYPVGSTLPTEHELCEMFNVSRFTVREALRRLRDASLVTRKPRAGTTVIASHRPTRTRNRWNPLKTCCSTLRTPKCAWYPWVWQKPDRIFPGKCRSRPE